MFLRRASCPSRATGVNHLLILGPPEPGYIPLNVPIPSVTDIPDLDPSDVNQLLPVDPDSWSAITVSANGREAIITNSNHRRGRSSTDIMHELAHLLLGHDPSTMFYVSEEDIALRGFSRAADYEANWLAGTLLLPREDLVYLRANGISNPDDHFK